MATASVTTPQISVSAKELFDRIDGLTNLIDRIIGAEGVLAVLDQASDEDTPENGAINGAWHLIHDCREMACAMDWPGNYRAQCERALGITEDDA